MIRYIDLSTQLEQKRSTAYYPWSIFSSWSRRAGRSQSSSSTAGSRCSRCTGGPSLPYASCQSPGTWLTLAAFSTLWTRLSGFSNTTWRSRSSLNKRICKQINMHYITLYDYNSTTTSVNTKDYYCT